MQTLMKYFLTLLTGSLLLVHITFAGEIHIVAKVGQEPITNIDLQTRIETLQSFIPNFQQYKREKQHMFALQSLIQGILKKSYIQRVNFIITAQEKAQYTQYLLQTLASMKIKNINSFVKKYPDFIETEILWQAFTEKTIRPTINVTDSMLETIHAQQKKHTKEQVKDLIIQQQVESQTMQILESLRKISFIEVYI